MLASISAARMPWFAKARESSADIPKLPVTKINQALTREYSFDDLARAMKKMSRRTFLNALFTAAKVAGLGINPLAPQDPFAHLGTAAYRHQMISTIQRKFPRIFEFAHDCLFNVHRDDYSTLTFNEEWCKLIADEDWNKPGYCYDAQLFERVFARAKSQPGLAILRKILNQEEITVIPGDQDTRSDLIHAWQAANFLSSNDQYKGLSAYLNADEKAFFCDLFKVHDLVFDNFYKGPFALRLYELMKQGGMSGLKDYEKDLRKHDLLKNEPEIVSVRSKYALYEGEQYCQAQFAHELHQVPDPLISSANQFRD